MGVQLSEKESNLLALAWQCFEEPPKVSWEALRLLHHKRAMLIRALPVGVQLTVRLGQH
ncbi:hypothetical protein M433DRAFT_159730 [Acidomyces richmondensis BFW]|nr:MAG: hypothetical protein FE78DRAFT_94205 [Acidomyces sp. 'richmondensis']KYG40902.1 hypothetical protein M433DRAFT_159730 [Acidomyces richmondensis BFW]